MWGGTRDERKAWIKGLRDRGEDVTKALSAIPRPEGLRRWLVAPILAPMIERLSRGVLGWCNATAAGLRVMAFIDTGYVFGAGSIPRFIAREVKRGKLRHKRMPPGAYFRRTGKWTRNGTQLNRYESEAERRERLWRQKIERRKQRRERLRLLEEKRRAERRRRDRGPSAALLEATAAAPLEQLAGELRGRLPSRTPAAAPSSSSSTPRATPSTSWAVDVGRLMAQGRFDEAEQLTVDASWDDGRPPDK